MKTTFEKRIEFLGCPVDCVTGAELLEDLKRRILGSFPPTVIQFVNANKVAMVRKDPSLGRILAKADYVLADGQPMLPMAAMLGLRIPERIDGIGLMKKLLGLADREHFSVYLLGASQKALDACARRIRLDFPGLRLVGCHNGYFSESEIPAVTAEIRKLRPDFLFLGMGSPMKERFAHERREELGARVIQGVGGSFDVISGMVKRAPLWMQRSGIEWLYRIIQEPRRMFWRYVRTNGSCLGVFFDALAKRWLSAGSHPMRGRSSSGSSVPDVHALRPHFMLRHSRMPNAAKQRSRSLQSRATGILQTCPVACHKPMRYGKTVRRQERMRRVARGRGVA